MSAKTAFLEKVKSLAGAEFVGTTEEDKKVVKKLEGEVEGLVKDLGALNTKLNPLTYLHSLNPTSADVALYTELHPQVSKLDPPTYYSLPSLTRYFNHIQHLPPLNDARALLPNTEYTLVEFDLDNMPKIERKVEVREKKEKKPKAGGAGAEGQAEGEGKKDKAGKKEKKETTAAATESATATAPAPAPTSAAKDATPAPAESTESTTGQSSIKKQSKKEKKAAAAGGEGGDAAPAKKEKKQQAAAPEVTGPMPSMIDLRVGRVLEVSRHPDADSLYVEKIDVGEETGPRTVCSGLVKYMTEEDILGQDLIIVCNLKPVTMRGVKSFAMLLCASSEAGKDEGIEFVRPPAGSKPGERIYFEGEKYENATPEAQLNPKKKVFETIQPNFTTLDTLEACWIDPETKSVHKIRTKDGVCKVQKFVGASLS